MLNTFEIFCILILIISIGIGIYFFYSQKKYENYLNTSSFARGCNMVANETKTLTCGNNHVISIESARQICTGQDSSNFDMGSNNDLESMLKTGRFNPETTVNFKKTLGKSCNGKSKCNFTFNPEDFPNGKMCSASGSEIHLIGTYLCVPK